MGWFFCLSVVQRVHEGLFSISFVYAAMAKRVKYLTESEIARMMNEESDSSDSETDIYVSEESDVCEDDDDDDSVISDANRASNDGWSQDMKDLPLLTFLSKSGLNLEPEELPEKELDFFSLFFNEELIELITRETNEFASAFFTANISDPGPSDAPSNFVPVTDKEIRVFLALVMLMSIIKKPTIHMYFTTDTVFATPFFNSAMSRNRFCDVLRFLHFTSDSSGPRLYKIQPVLEILSKNFKELYTPDREICIDESLFGWKGRIGFRQYIPSKRARYGIKIYKLCESQTGYIWNFLIYTGKDTELINTSGLYGERVVKTLLSTLENKGYNLYLDRFFASPNLAFYLNSVKTNICGTVSKNRSGMPKSLPRKFQKDKFLAFQKNSVNVFGFKDKKKDVVIITSIHNNQKVPTGKKDRQTKEEILKPHCVVEYNKYMGGVDTGDSVMYHYPAFRKTIKWYRKLFFGFMDMALYNANVLFMKSTGKKLSNLEFKSRVIYQIVEKYIEPKMTKLSSKSPVPNPLRLTGRHFPSLYINDKGVKSRKRCVVCTRTRVKERRFQRTYYECKICGVGLCVEECFEKYHTLQNF